MMATIDKAIREAAKEHGAQYRLTHKEPYLHCSSPTGIFSVTESLSAQEKAYKYARRDQRRVRVTSIIKRTGMTS